MGFSKKRTHISKKDGSGELSYSLFFKRAVVFLIVFLAFSALFSLIFGLIFYQGADPTSKVNIASILTLYSSVAVSAFLFSRKNGQYHFISGLMLGMLVFAIISLFSLAFGGYSEFWVNVFIPLVASLFGILGKKRPSNKRKRRRRTA